jgi:superfamily II DNA or RNA helicase
MTKKEKTQLQKEVVDTLEYHPHGILYLAPRVGKTKMIIDLIKRDKYASILWVTPEAELADTAIPNEFKQWGGTRYLKKLTTSTYASLHKVVGFYDIVILDEIQHLTLANSLNLVNRSLDYISIIGMTGTETQHEAKQDLYKELELKSLYRISINNAVDIGLLSDYEINVVSVEMDTAGKVPAGTKEKPFLAVESENYNYLTKRMQRDMSMFNILSRMRFIKNSPSKTKVAKKLISLCPGRKLIFAGSIKQIEDLTPNCYHSKTDGKALRAFKNFDLDTLGLVNSGGTGHTYKKVDHLILVQSDSDKNGLTSQKLTRCLLAQRGFKATIWIVMLTGTQDVKWVETTLNSFDRTKVKYINAKELEE